MSLNASNAAAGAPSVDDQIMTAGSESFCNTNKITADFSNQELAPILKPFSTVSSSTIQITTDNLLGASLDQSMTEQTGECTCV